MLVVVRVVIVVVIVRVLAGVVGCCRLSGRGRWCSFGAVVFLATEELVEEAHPVLPSLGAEKAQKNARSGEPEGLPDLT